MEAVVGSEMRQALEEVAPGRTLTLPLSDARASAHVIADFARFHRLDAVIPTDDQTAIVAAHASLRLGLPHNPLEAVLRARRKDLSRARLREAGVAAPRHRLLPIDPSPDDRTLAALAAEQTYPAVLKPVFLAASRGVIRADNGVSFAAAFRRIEALLSRPEIAARGDGESRRRLLAEEFVQGPEVAVEALLTRGRLKVLAIFDKPDPLDGPFFEETIYVTPSRLPDDAQQAIVRVVGAGAAALGLREGPVHAEVRLGWPTPDAGRGGPPRPPAAGPEGSGPYLIEIAARSIGGLCARALRFGVGITLEELVLMHALGRDVEACERERRPAGVMMIPIPRRGRLRAVQGLEAARTVPGLEEGTITIATGTEVEPLPEGGAYLGFLFARRDTPEEVENALRQAHARLEVVIDSGERGA